MIRRICTIGQGYQNCVIPAFLRNHFFRNPHIYTPYTPYQAEISQGRLEMLYNYQTLISNIVQKDISIGSLLDSGQVGMDIIIKTKKWPTINRMNDVFGDKSLLDK